ncbi:MAG: gas vesicle protein [Acidimicrobiales bacterium]|nr:gas vesicle protein [Acidimicrobiales bacterium]
MQAGDRTGLAGSPEPANLGDILERVLDRGLVIVGDIRVNLLDIELLTIKLRLLVASVETARELGIDWWQHDPWLTSDNNQLAEENRRLRRELATAAEDRVLAEENRRLRQELAAAKQDDERSDRGDRPSDENGRE